MKTLKIFTLTLILLQCFYLTIGTISVMSYDSSITYLDGANEWERCNPYVARTVAGESGMLISHHGYGTTPYNESKNCVVMMVAPLGYRIRLKIADFNVPGNPTVCDKDSLHILDHEKPIDLQKLSHSTDSDRTPGPIMGNFCGSIADQNRTLISSHNSLTVWWHTDPSMMLKADDSGFRLIWSSFRKPTFNDPCNDDEFTCLSGECLPYALGCNRFADCEDSSDLDRRRQVAHQCPNISTNFFSELDGPKKFLLCVFIVVLALIIVGGLCLLACFLFPKQKPRRIELKTTDLTNSPLNGGYHPQGSQLLSDNKRPPVPNFSPPSHYPPAAYQFHQQHPHLQSHQPNIPNTILRHVHFPCSNDQITNTTTTTKSSSNPSGNNPIMYKLTDNYPSLSGFESSYIVPPPPATPAPSDYTYIRTDSNRLMV